MDLLALFFPKKCLKCGKNGKYICEQCIDRVPSAYLNCVVCHKPCPLGQTHLKCKTKTSLDGVVGVWKYTGVVRIAIVKFKYNFSFDIASELIEKAADKIKTSGMFRNFIMIGIPLYPKREKWRGFNQANLLVEGLAKQLGLSYYSDILIRIKDTPTQVSLSKENRVRSIRGVFAVNKETVNKVNGKKVVIIDDVITTGSTINEAASILKKEGVREVWGLTLAK